MGNRAMSKELITLGNRVREERKRQGLSQESLAELVGVSTNTVSRIEGGQTAMSVDVFRKIVQELGIDANELLGIKQMRKENDGSWWALSHDMKKLEKRELDVVCRTMETLVSELRKS